MLNKKAIISIFTICLLLQSCDKPMPHYELPGKIALKRLMDKKYSLFYDNNFVSSFASKDIEYNCLSWTNSRNLFVGLAILGESNDVSSNFIAIFDTTGRVVEKIYECKKGEATWPLYTSKEDKYLLLYQQDKSNSVQQSLQNITPTVSLLVMDLVNKKVTKIIPNFGVLPNLEIKESPWLYNEYKFVYSIDTLTKVINDNTSNHIIDYKQAGVYLYDINSNKDSLIVASAYSAVASPVSSEIAYIKGNSIRILEINTMNEKIIYSFGSKERINNMHWSPDGYHIYFTYTRRLGIWDFFTAGETIINCHSAKKVNFKSIGHGFNTYTWR